jgi:hypothetical protein
MAEKICPKCGSSNINFQIEQTASIGGSIHRIGGEKHHGVLYWACIGWWWKPLAWFFRWLLRIGTLGIMGRKRDKGIGGKTITASKNINKTMAVCQNCGHTWKA